jgi:hypothetical protein
MILSVVHEWPPLHLSIVLEEELTRREDALDTREEMAWISEKTLTTVSADFNAERAKAEATRKEFLNKIEAHTTRGRQFLGLDEMLGEKKVLLDQREWDLRLHEAALVEVQTWGVNPQDNREELMEVAELQRLL